MRYYSPSPPLFLFSFHPSPFPLFPLPPSPPGQLKSLLIMKQEIPTGNLFPLLRILLHLSLTPAVAQTTRTAGMKAVIHILQRCFPSIRQLNPTETIPETSFNESDSVAVEALKVLSFLIIDYHQLINILF